MRLNSKNLIANNSLPFILFATLASFLTYTGMYAIRKAFAAGTYRGHAFIGIDYKIWLVIAQTIGYTISKWIGIKIVAENSTQQRPKLIIGLTGISLFALLFFAIIPEPYGIVLLFINGLPIGMVFGLVFNYLEGRKTTEILVIGLTITQIFSSGLVKSIGKYYIQQYNISETWMPFLVGLSFFPVLLLSVWMLKQIPPQNEEDIALKSKRISMSLPERKSFVKTFLPGLIIFLLSYVFMTAYRDFRDNFSAEIWDSLGYPGGASIFTITEIPVSIVLFLMMLMLQKVKHNLKAFMLIHAMGIVGAMLLIVGTALYVGGVINAMIWICVTGIGLYMAYVPANTIFFERMFAVFKYPGNAGFIVIMADFYGYCGSLGILLYRNFGTNSISYSRFFLYTSIIIGSIILCTQTASVLYYWNKQKIFFAKK